MAVPDDKGVVAVFRNDVVKNPRKSAEAGRPIFDDLEVVELRWPGSKDYGVYPALSPSHWGDDPLTGEYRRITFAERFSKQYQQFKAHDRQTKAGTPLDHLTFLTAAKCAELRALNIYTAEALAIIDGSELKNLGPGGRDLKNQAIEYLENSTDQAKFTKMEAELEMVKARNQVLEDDLKLQPAVKETPTEYDGMSDDEIKEHLKALTGITPRGNPNRKTLIRMAQEQKGNVAA